jgi:hypothetical protein
MTPPCTDSFAPVFGSRRGTGAQPTPQPRDPLADFLRWLDDETSRRSVEWEEFEGSLKDHGFALDEPSFWWGYDGYDKHPCALWKCPPDERKAELVGFPVVTTEPGFRVVGYELFAKSVALRPVS